MSASSPTVVQSVSCLESKIRVLSLNGVSGTPGHHVLNVASAGEPVLLGNILLVPETPTVKLQVKDITFLLMYLCFVRSFVGNRYSTGIIIQSDNWITGGRKREKHVNLSSVFFFIKLPYLLDRSGGRECGERVERPRRRRRKPHNAQPGSAVTGLIEQSQWPGQSQRSESREHLVARPGRSGPAGRSRRAHGGW